MKLWKLLVTLALCLTLPACGSAPAETPPVGTEPSAAAADPGPGTTVSLDPDEEPTILTCRVVDGAEEGSLLLAELGEGLYGGTGVYRLDLRDVAVTLDGEPADASALEDGMTVDAAFNGSVLETFPAQFGEVYSLAAWSIGQEKNPAGTCYDLCGLYLQVLDDLWQKDPGLNEGITVAGLDLSQAPGELTESEKTALAWRFGERHGVEVVTGTFDELKEQGYFTAEPLGEGAPEGAALYRWDDGCLFSITPSEEHEGEVYSLPALFFNAEKWRSPLGAYCLHDCQALWPEAGAWSGYTIGGEMIS